MKFGVKLEKGLIFFRAFRDLELQMRGARPMPPNWMEMCWEDPSLWLARSLWFVTVTPSAWLCGSSTAWGLGAISSTGLWAHRSVAVAVTLFLQEPSTVPDVKGVARWTENEVNECMARKMWLYPQLSSLENHLPQELDEMALWVAGRVTSHEQRPTSRRRYAGPNMQYRAKGSLDPSANQEDGWGRKPLFPYSLAMCDQDPYLHRVPLVGLELKNDFGNGLDILC